MNPPKLAAGLEAVPLPDGVVVVNGGSPVLFQGRAATELLVPLLQALDGLLNAEGLASTLDLPDAQVTRGLQLLAERGLLESE